MKVTPRSPAGGLLDRDAAPTRTTSGAVGRSSAALARGIVLGGVLALSAFLQCYRLDDWQFFSDDQAAQLNVVHGMLVDHHPPLLGLALSIGHAHIGPLFYYLLALPLWLGHLDPTAGVAMIGLFQVGTVYLLYRLCCRVGAPWAGLCTAGLYATSGLVVYWSRFLWPNVTPFFVALALYALVALAQGQAGYLVLLAASLAAAAQMQPTAALLIPVAVIWLALWRPRATPWLVGQALAVVVVLFAPAIVYDLTHHFAETRAWLSYAMTVRPGGGHASGMARGVAAMEQFGWRAVGFRTRSWVDALLALAALAVLACAIGVAGRPRAMLARLLLLWGGIYLIVFSLYHGTLHPHYVEPLYPLPFLAIGLLLDLAVTAPMRAARRFTLLHHADTDARGPGVSPSLGACVVNVLGWVAYLGTAVVVGGLATANVRHLWANHFALDLYQLDSPAEVQGSEIMLGEMRGATALIARSAAGRPYSFLVAVRDGAGGGYQYLLRHAPTPPAPTLRRLQFLLVEPADRPPWLWPPATRRRWSTVAGGFVTLPHLLIWRLLPGHARLAPDAGRWRTTADTAGAMTALIGMPGGMRRLLAGFIGGAALSDDGGRRWRRVEWMRGPNGLDVISSFAWSAACPRRIYAGTFDGVVVSTDGGRTWERLSAQPASTEILALWADPRRCDVLLAGTRAGVVRTADGGQTWQLAPVRGSRRLAVHALGADGRTLYTGTDGGVWISNDGGRSWQSRHKRGEPGPLLCLLGHLAGSRRLLAGTGFGAVYSGDGGMTWAPAWSGLQGATYALLATGAPGTVLAGTDAGLYVSHDYGATWRRAAVPPDVTVSAFSTAAGSGGPIYAASNRGLYRSTDGGETWIQPTLR